MSNINSETTRLSDLADVDSEFQPGDMLTYNGTSWERMEPSEEEGDTIEVDMSGDISFQGCRGRHKICSHMTSLGLGVSLVTNTILGALASISPLGTPSNQGGLRLSVTGALLAVASYSVDSGGGEVILGTKSCKWDGDLQIDTLATAEQDYRIQIGMHRNWTGTSEVDNGVYFEYDRSKNSNWILCSRADSTETAVNTSIAVATGLVKLKLEVNAAASLVTFYMDGASVGTISTNIPSGTSRPVAMMGLRFQKKSGLTTRTIGLIYWAFIYRL